MRPAILIIRPESYVTDTIHPPSHRYLRIRVCICFLIHQQCNDGSLFENISICINQGFSCLLSKQMGTCTFSPGPDDGEINSFKIRVAIISFPYSSYHSPEILGIARIFRINGPFVYRTVIFPFLVRTNHFTVPIRHIPFITGAIWCYPEQQCLPS